MAMLLCAHKHTHTNPSLSSYVLLAVHFSMCFECLQSVSFQNIDCCNWFPEDSRFHAGTRTHTKMSYILLAIYFLSYSSELLLLLVFFLPPAEYISEIWPNSCCDVTGI